MEVNDQTMVAAPTFGDIEGAAALVASVAHDTPVMTSAEADRRTGSRLHFKMENFQRGGAFKFRGAYNAISRLDRAQQRSGVVAFSSGNHAQAVALAARILGIKATVVMPSDAPRTKLSAVRDYGAEVVTYDRATEDRDQITTEIVSTTGASLIPPFDHPHIIAGQGTAAAELFRKVGPLDYLFVPVGGGGLISGCAIAATTLSPDCLVVGVEPEAGNDVQRSLEAGRIIQIAPPSTIADGARTVRAGAITFPIIRSLVRRVVTVSDDALRGQMSFFLERMKVAVEPTGCLGAAAAMSSGITGARIGVIVSGGNVDIEFDAAGLHSADSCRLTIV